LLPERGSHGWQIQYRHEPEILETGGGLANVLDLLGSEEPFFVYNGDILTDIDLVLAQQTHAEHKNLVTLILLPHGRVQNVAFDAQSGLVRDLRGALGAAHLPQYQFTGIYLVEPRFAAYLVPGKKESVVEAFLRAIRAGERIGGVLAAGNWWDLGDAQSYQEAHAEMGRTVFPRYSFPPEWKRPIHPSALLPEAIQVNGSCIGARARISADCTLEQCLVWPDAVVPGHTTARGKIFF
jgi:mannose-1-phosphate guanylyltransferase